MLRAWPVRLPAELLGKDLAPADQQAILARFRPRIDALNQERGYVAEDVIALRASNPKLDEIMAKFTRCDTHSDDEVRAILDLPAAGARARAARRRRRPAYHPCRDQAPLQPRRGPLDLGDPPLQGQGGVTAKYCDPPAYAR